MRRGLGVASAFAAEGELVVMESAGQFCLFELVGNVLVWHFVLSGLD